MISHFAELYEKKFNYILFLHQNKSEISTLEISRNYCNELMAKLEFIIEELKNDNLENNKFYYLSSQEKLEKISEMKSNLILLSLVKFLHINRNRLTYMNELRYYIYSYGLNVDLETCDAFSAPENQEVPFNINKEKIYKLVRLCDFENLVKIFENIKNSLMTAPNLEKDFKNEHVELREISTMLKDFFEYYQELINNKITKPEIILNEVRGKIKEIKYYKIFSFLIFLLEKTLRKSVFLLIKK